MKKQFLVLGAGRGQVGLIKAARELGCEVSVATMVTGKEPGIALADKVIEADISSPTNVLEAIKGYQFDAVATSCMDTPLPALATVAEAQGLLGITADSAAICSNKVLMKRVFQTSGVRTAPFVVLKASDSLESAHHLTLPVVVKAPDLQGSRGVFICDTWDAAKIAFGQIRTYSKSDSVVVEEFISGIEFGAQALVENGEVKFIECHGDTVFASETNIPVVHYMPFEGDKELVADAKVQISTAIKAVGLDNCAVNVDMINHAGEVYIIELTGRVGANCLPELTGARFRLDYYAEVARLALGESTLANSGTIPDSPCLYAEMLFSDTKAGRLKSISADFSDDRIIHHRLFVAAGDEIRLFKSSNDCIGEVLVGGSSIEECQDLVKSIRASIAIETEE